MKMRFIVCLFLMGILLSGVTAKLWDIPPEDSSCPEYTVLRNFIGKLLINYKQHMVPSVDAEEVEFNMKIKLNSSDLHKIFLYLERNKDVYEVEDALMSMLVEVPSELPPPFYENSYVLRAISFCTVNTLLKPVAYVGENIGLFFQKLLQYILVPLLVMAAIFNLIVLLLVIIEYYGYSIGGLLIPVIPQTIKNKLDKVMEILDKIPNIDNKVEEIHEILQKKINLENKPELPSMENDPASGYFGGVQETGASLKLSSQSLGDLHQTTW